MNPKEPVVHMTYDAHYDLQPGTLCGSKARWDTTSDLNVDVTCFWCGILLNAPEIAS
jgi:hypothetical protein